MTIDDTVAKPGIGQTIVIIDDEAAILQVYGFMLESRGYFVQKFSTGADAIAELTKVEPHLAIIDFRLPDISGIELYGAIKLFHPNLQVLFNSGSIDPSYVSMLAKQCNLTSHHFIEKTCEPAVLFDRVAHLCKQSQERFESL